MRENREITEPGSVPVPLSALYRKLDEHAADSEAPYDLPAGLQRLNAWMAEAVHDNREPVSVSGDTGPVSRDARAAAAGDEDAWSRLVERFSPLVRSAIRSCGLSGHDMENVSQTLWLRLVEHLKDLRNPLALPGWIRTTARNECVQLLRSTGRSMLVGAPIDPHALSPVIQKLDEDLMRAERHQALLAALTNLPDHQRNLLTLLVADPPLPYAEISRRLGIPIGSIGPSRARALRRLRESYAIATILEMGAEEIQ